MRYNPNPRRKVKVAHYNYSCSRSDSDDSVEGYIPLLMLLLVVSALLESLVVTCEVKSMQCPIIVMIKGNCQVVHLFSTARVYLRED